MIRAIIVALVFASGVARADTAPPEVEASLGQPVLQGATDFEFLGFDLFDASLWTDGTGYSDARPFALSLTYARRFTAEQLTRQTIRELARIEGSNTRSLAALASLEACFADVGRGDRITAVRLSSDGIRFFVNGRVSCDYQDAGFANRFFSIWLGDETRDPRRRDRLLGVG
ncbi:MAG: chalcone isomerase family protein [Pseudomonadota bacterium]